ncbi:MAG: tetratricopeptide repeat protein [Acetobacteraceae bacterium]|nr:tetratricopeptide repeat protein [Acetobacteraceae bacterium]
MPDIFDEVAEDLRAERASRLWKRYGTLVLGALVFVLAGIGAHQSWRWYEAREAEKAGMAFMAAHRAAEAEGADLKSMAQRFEEASRGAPAGYRDLARLRAAALKAETGDLAEALRLYDAIAADSSADPLYRDLASLLWVIRSLDQGDLAMLAARITPLARPDSAWNASAREIAGLIALRAGRRDEARQAFQALAADVTAPRGVRERAQRLAMGLEG